MMYSTVAVLALVASEAAAFPAGMMDSLKDRAVGPPQGAGALPLVPPPFSPTQYVSNKGQYAFVAPGPTDIRGECPGLNAMANHGYLPHNGRATIAQFINATQTVFGMGPDLAGFLAVYGALVDGDGQSWSLLGGPRIGIGGSHGNYETDSSPLKSDLNQYGSNTRTIMSQFYTLYNAQPDPATANYNLEVLRTFRGQRFQESVAKNPYFTYNPFAGIEVSQAAFTFIYRFMSNKSAAAPEGILNKDVLKSFMSITGPENNLTHTPGYEKIPDNWYKRNDADVYTIPYFQTDILYFAQTVPQVLSVGCNQGRVNSYNSFDVSTLTGGAYTSQSVAANPLCFSTQYAYYTITQRAALANKIPVKRDAAFNLVSQALGVTCPSIKTFDAQSASSICPGLSFYGGPDGPVAPGAIQS